ncbi:MAG: carboxypeptidase regulatory-like domain-containing protein [Saprospiraceae bacterium]|nr:carboxypeptidase regulatory-like domain-containing protein [Saprospiraceae bacterium]
MKKCLLWGIILLSLSACRKDTEETIVTETYFKPPVVRVKGTVAGRVTTDLGYALEGVSVYIGSQQTITGPDGHFLFRNADLDANGTYIRAEHPNCFHASRRIFPSANSTNYTDLTLIWKSSGGMISASEGGVVTLPGGAKVTLPPNSIVTRDGLPYNGQLLVLATWLDPTGPNLDELMPGNLVGINSDDREVSLASYGMIGVVLQVPGTINERLQLAPGAEAELFFPVPAPLLQSAPETIPLWHFDERDGLWREEGEAFLQNGGYMGKVKHFSFWNCDAPFPSSSISGRITDGSGRPTSGVTLRILFPSRSLTARGSTNSAGYFTGRIPTNEPLVLEIHLPCSGVASRNIGPFSGHADLGDIRIDDPAFSTLHVSGRLLDCGGNPIYGLARVCWSDGCRYIAADADGYFSERVTFCQGSQLTYFGIDTDALWQNGPRLLNSVIDAVLGDVRVCAPNTDSYIRVNLLGEEDLFLTQVQLFANSDSTIVYASRNDATSVGVGANIFQRRGIFQGVDVLFNYTGKRTISGEERDIFTSCSIGACPNSFTVIFTDNWLDWDGFVRGSFEGKLDVLLDNGQVLSDVPIHGDFRRPY